MTEGHRRARVEATVHLDGADFVITRSRANREEYYVIREGRTSRFFIFTDAAGLNRLAAAIEAVRKQDKENDQ